MHMIDPALHAGVKFRKADLSGTVLLPALPQKAKVVHIAGFDPAVLGIHEKPEPGNAILHWRDLRLGIYSEGTAKCRLLPHTQC